MYGAKYYGEAKILHYQCTMFDTEAKESLFILFLKNTFYNIRENKGITPEVKELFSNWFAGLTTPTKLISGVELKLVSQPFFIVLKKKNPKFIVDFLNNTFKTLISIKNLGGGEK